MVMPGLTWAPEMWPVAKMTIIIASPAVAALPTSVTEPFVFSFTIGVAVAAKISTNVPMNSAAIWLQEHFNTCVRSLLMNPVLTSEAMNLSIHSFSDKIFDLGKLELCVCRLATP